MAVLCRGLGWRGRLGLTGWDFFCRRCTILLLGSWSPGVASERFLFIFFPIFFFFLVFGFDLSFFRLFASTRW